MYQIIGIGRTLFWFAVSCIALFLVMHGADTLTLLSGPLNDLWRAVTSTVVLGSLLLALLGQSPVFAWLCRLPFISEKFPPISGEWDITVESNWGVMLKWLGEGDGSSLHSVEGRVKIKARFFGVKMEFISRDGYSESQTINVAVRPSQQGGLIELNYMYTNFTLVPKATDTSCHTGAARVFVKESEGELSMVGIYFTDRKWTEGLNTAGTVTFRRASKV